MSRIVYPFSQDSDYNIRQGWHSSLIPSFLMLSRYSLVTTYVELTWWEMYTVGINMILHNVSKF